MRALNDLNEILTENSKALKLNAKSWDIWMENGTLQAGGMKETEHGRQYARIAYRAAVYIERLPSDRAALLLALIRQYADQRAAEDTTQNADPEFDVQTLSERLVNVEITLQITDPLYMTEVEESPIAWAGKKLAPGAHPFGIAETGTVTGGTR